MSRRLSGTFVWGLDVYKRQDYRKFKIKGVEGADDYGSMREVLTRRFAHGLKERQESKELGKFTVFPDLILMDGGKGQVNVALEVLDSCLLYTSLALIAITISAWSLSCFNRRSLLSGANPGSTLEA